MRSHTIPLVVLALLQPEPLRLLLGPPPPRRLAQLDVMLAVEDHRQLGVRVAQPEGLRVAVVLEI